MSITKHVPAIVLHLNNMILIIYLTFPRPPALKFYFFFVWIEFLYYTFVLFFVSRRRPPEYAVRRNRTAECLNFRLLLDRERIL